MYDDFIKHYNIIRDILRDCFLYGCYSRNGLENKRNLSSRKISYEMRRIHQYVGDRYVKTEMDGRYKLLSLSYDFIKHTDNFLVNTFMTKSFTRIDVILYFLIQAYLNSKEEPCSLNDIISGLIDEGHISADNISSKSIERKLGEMESVTGVLKYTQVKRAKYYYIAEDILKELNKEELLELSAAVSLYKNIVFPVTEGYFCEITLRNYMKYERGIYAPKADFFSYRNLHFHPVIEEEILWEALKAIDGGLKVEVIYSSFKNRTGEEKKLILMPYKIRYDIRHGRLYMISFNDYGKCVSSRLDRIESIGITKETFNREKYKDKYDYEMCHSWSSLPLDKKKPENVKFELYIDEEKEKYILDKISYEAPECIVQKKCEGIYIVDITVNDSSEMIPWLRSYAGYIKVIENRKIAKGLSNDWKEMLASYGAV